MKKMILGLLLCLGISQAAVAMQGDSNAAPSQNQISKILAWAKANPKTATAIGTTVVAVAFLGGLTIFEIVKADGKVTGQDNSKSFSWKKKFGNGIKFNQTRTFFKNGWEKTRDSKFGKHVGAHKLAYEIGVPVSAFLLVLAALVLTDYETAESVDQMKTVEGWNKFLQLIHVKNATPAQTAAAN